MSLSPSIGRVIPPGEYLPARTWAVDGILLAGGVTAIAVADRTQRTRLGVAVLDALMNERPRLLGQQVRVEAHRACAVISGRAVQNDYRAVRDSEELAVILAQPRSTQDYWSCIQAEVIKHKAEVVVVDVLQSLDPSPDAITALTRFGNSVVALMRGNATKAGVGGDHLWDAADIKLWFDAAKRQMVPVDGSTLTEPWPVELNELPAPEALPLDNDQRCVVRTAQLAKALSAPADTDKAISQLLTNHPAEVADIWGEVSFARLLAQLRAHKRLWSAAFDGRPITAADIDDSELPPF